MNDRVCDNCKKIYSSNTYSSCPYCNNQPKETNETSPEFRIDHNPGEKKCLKEDIKGATVIIIILVIVLGVFAPTLLIFGLIFFANAANGDYSYIMHFLIPLILSLLDIFAIFYFINIIFKTKSLMKNGIILENIKYTVTKDRVLLAGQTTGLIKVRSVYVGEDGTEHVFKGILPGYMTKKGEVCDIIVDPNNYKKYIIRYIIN